MEAEKVITRIYIILYRSFERNFVKEMLSGMEVEPLLVRFSYLEEIVSLCTSDLDSDGYEMSLVRKQVFSGKHIKWYIDEKVY